MSWKFSAKSQAKLKKIHPDLAAVVALALHRSKNDFTVLEGWRTLERQAELVKAGASKTMNSRHLTGHAVDLGVLVQGKIRWDWPLYHELSVTMKAAAAELGIPLDWGGDWKSFKDGPHYQLPFKQYPKGK